MNVELRSTGRARAPVPTWSSQNRKSQRRLPCDFFQQLLIDVEVRRDVLHVVVIFERFHQADHRVGLLRLRA